MKINYLVNPFTRIAGLKSLIAGLTGLLLVSWLSYQTGTHQNGLSNIDFAKDADFVFYLIEHLAGWISVSIFLFISGLILSKTKIRLLDVLGTSSFARIPLVIVPLVRLIPSLRSFVFLSWEMYLVSAIYLLSAVWTIALLFNGFKISCNLKKERLIVSFIVSLILSEAATKLLIIFITFKP